MQIETIGKYQLHLIAHEVPGGGWDPYVSVFKFDDEAQDFICIVEKHRASDHAIADYNEAIKAAACAGNAYIKTGNI